MNRDRIKRIYDLHAWSGVICGLYIFVVSLSGVFAMFGHELHTWEDENIRITLSDQPEPVMPLLSRLVADKAQNSKVESLFVSFPTPIEPYYKGFLRVRSSETGKAENHIRRWHPNTGEALPERGEGLAHWIVDFHRNLMLERTVGRGLVGLSGIFLLLSIISGVVTHRKLLREAFTWRLHRSVRLKWQDSHKAIGLWGIPFHVMIAFTGAWLGLVVILLPLTAEVTFKGDQSALFEVIFGTPHKAAGVSAKMFSIDDARQRVAEEVDAQVASVSIENWGDRNAEFTFRYNPEGVLLTAAFVKVGGVTGEIKSIKLTRKPGASYRVVSAISILHYGLYGGVLLKFFHVLLGLLLCIVTATGLMMWLERRLHGNEGRSSPAFYKALSRTTVGVCTGMGLASFAIFYADKLLPAEPEYRITMIGTVYFIVWGLVIIYGWLRQNEYRTCKEILAVTGICAAGLPILNTATSEHTILQSLQLGQTYVAGTDITGAIFGITLLLVSWWLPSQRKG